MNSKQHFAIGVGVGVFLDLVKQGIQMQLNPARHFDWIELAGCGVLGGTVALLPDILEPAVHPNHRGFFHSVTCGGLAVYAAYGEHTQAWEPEARHLARSVCWSYVSHLAADASTPRGIRML